MSDFNHILDKTGEISKLKKGTLYVVSSPIGNTEDISFRALHVLKNADVVLAEDSRVTSFLLNKYGIRKKIISFFSRIENKKTDFVISCLKNGDTVALISDSGTPLISDPGSMLVKKCIDEGLNIRSVPGASALNQSFVLSGLRKTEFYFQGFIPVKKSRNKTFEEFRNINVPIIIYESKYRMTQTINDIYKYLGNAEIFIGRELTKKFEQVLSGRVKDFINGNNFKNKGEFTIIINRN